MDGSMSCLLTIQTVGKEAEVEVDRQANRAIDRICGENNALKCAWKCQSLVMSHRGRSSIYSDG